MGDPMGGMFGPDAMIKLEQNPKTREYLKDPKFKNMLELCK